MASKQKDSYHLYMRRTHENLAMARTHAHHAKNAEDDIKAMEHDFLYAEHMAHAMFYLTHARNLRIKEKTNYGYQF